MKQSKKQQLYLEYFDKALSYQNKNNYLDAIKEYVKASNVNKKAFLPIHNIGISYFYLKEYENCEKFLLKALQMEPENSLTAINLAVFYYKQLKYKDAAKYFRKGINNYLDDSNILTLFCNTLCKLKKYKEAVYYLKKINLDVNTNTDLHIMIVDNLIKQEKFKECKGIISEIKLNDVNSERALMQKNLINLGIEYNKNIKIKNRVMIKSLCDFIKVINNLCSENDKSFIFRGQTNKYLPLIPTLYRNKSYISNEQNIIQDFSLKAEAFFDREIELFDKIDKLTLMQHYGVPTRLLDFTESPLIALFFALEKISTESFNTAPCVYCINLKAFSYNKNGNLLSSKHVESLEPQKIFKYNTGTCAFFSKLKNKRLTAQKGVFVLFNENKPLELLVDSNYITKIEIDREYIDQIKTELNNIGITHSVIYPDFYGLSEEIKNPHKFVTEQDNENNSNSSITFNPLFALSMKANKRKLFE